jgi:hypothetical protein
LFLLADISQQRVGALSVNVPTIFLYSTLILSAPLHSSFPSDPLSSEFPTKTLRSFFFSPITGTPTYLSHAPYAPCFDHSNNQVQGIQLNVLNWKNKKTKTKNGSKLQSRL